jgi:quercetin dioxygenase-like cupin family protein
MTPPNLQQRYIKYEDLIPCKAAFIDAKTPGSHLKDNFSIIGGGVTESKHQKVNLSLAHGFCIGAAGQPPKIKNSPHSHFTAEVFMVFKGVWRFYWNNDCGNETILHPGDIISLPTNMFRGFENVGDVYGLIFSILGHDDAGGGVVWAPRVIEEAKGHGLILLENGKLVDTTIGEAIPDGIKPKAVLTEEELNHFDQYTDEEMSLHVGRKNSYKASSYPHFPNQTIDTLTYYDIIGPLQNDEHSFHVKPGDHNGDQFNVYGMQTNGNADTGKYSRQEVEVFLVHEGNFHVSCDFEGERIKVDMKAGDIFSFPKGSSRQIKSDSESFAYLVVGDDYPEAPKIMG